MTENYKKPILGNLTEEEKRRHYSPLNPADLVDALQDSIHIDIGISRPAKSIKKK